MSGALERALEEDLELTDSFGRMGFRIAENGQVMDRDDSAPDLARKKVVGSVNKPFPQVPLRPPTPQPPRNATAFARQSVLEQAVNLIQVPPVGKIADPVHGGLERHSPA
jgi:hypothetical protein